MSTTQASHEPSPDEVDHATTDGHDADHAHDGEALGPVDVRAWGALLLGVAAGLVIALCLVITTTLLATPSV
jgi:ABC-type nickel/cobalt efflux system permease component RcnA